MLHSQYILQLPWITINLKLGRTMLVQGPMENCPSGSVEFRCKTTPIYTCQQPCCLWKAAPGCFLDPSSWHSKRKNYTDRHAQHSSLLTRKCVIKVRLKHGWENTQFSFTAHRSLVVPTSISPSLPSTHSLNCLVCNEPTFWMCLHVILG